MLYLKSLATVSPSHLQIEFRYIKNPLLALVSFFLQQEVLGYCLISCSECSGTVLFVLPACCFRADGLVHHAPCFCDVVLDSLYSRQFQTSLIFGTTFTWMSNFANFSVLHTFPVVNDVDHGQIVWLCSLRQKQLLLANLRFSYNL